MSVTITREKTNEKICGVIPRIGTVTTPDVTSLPLGTIGETAEENRKQSEKNAADRLQRTGVPVTHENMVIFWKLITENVESGFKICSGVDEQLKKSGADALERRCNRMDNITYFNKAVHQETNGKVPEIAQDGMTEDFHTYKAALKNHISMIAMSEADKEVLTLLIDKMAKEALQSGIIQGVLLAGDR